MAVTVTWRLPLEVPDVIDAILAGADAVEPDDPATARRWRARADDLGDALDRSNALEPRRLRAV